jgi:hypothetical protein
MAEPAIRIAESDDDFEEARALVDQIADAARYVGCRRLRLDTLPPRMPAAAAMYRRHVPTFGVDPKPARLRQSGPGGGLLPA